MSQEYYQSVFSGEQIDQGIGFIVSGEFQEMVEDATTAAADVQEAIANIPEGSTPIVNNLTTGGANMALSAEQGKVLNALISEHAGNKDNPHGVTAEQVGAPTTEYMNMRDMAVLDASKAYTNTAVNGKSSKPTYATATMSASGWSGNTYSFEATYPKASYDISVEVAPTATAEQFEAFGGAMICGSHDSNVATALGDVPTVDIPIIIKVVAK